MRLIQSIKLAVVSIVALSSIIPAAAENRLNDVDRESRIALYHSDGSTPSYGIEAVNRSLMNVGVRVSKAKIPDDARPILKASALRAVTEAEADQLIDFFNLGRRELLDEIAQAGREPEMHRGGYLQTSEEGVAPYPKVYDMMALDHEATVFLQHKFGKLHVNSSEAGVGIDEVMTIVSGGPYTWFFVFPNGSVGKLRLGEVLEGGKAWRISYPGIRPHGGFLDPEYGLVVAYAHGPEQFEIHFDADNVAGSRLNGTNAWIDMSGEKPLLLDGPLTAN